MNGPERLDGLTEALRIWPELDGVLALYNKAFAAEPTLDVAVSDVAVPLGPWVHSPADARLTRLLYRPILASDDDDARKGKKPGQLAASIESSDLGRRLLLRIRPGSLWSDGSRPVSAIDVARDLVDRTDPHSPRYEARWADLLDRVEVTDDVAGRGSAQSRTAQGRALVPGPGGPGPCEYRRPRGDRRARIGRWSATGPISASSANGDQVELRLRDDSDTSAQR